MTRLREFLDRMLGALLAWLMGAAALNVIWQVVSRYLLASPSSFTDELARHLLVWLGLLGAAYGVGQKFHLAIDLLPTRLDATIGAVLATFVDLCLVGFALVVLVFGGAKLVIITASLGQTSAALGWPMAFIYLALPLSGFVMCAYGLLDLIERHRGGCDV